MQIKSPLQRGQWAEALAERWLTEQGLTPYQRNFRRRVGEIDLILQDRPNRQWVFVEVKYRQRNARVSGADAIGYHKQRKLLLAAQLFLAQQNNPDISARFDAIIITPTSKRTGHQQKTTIGEHARTTSELSAPNGEFSDHDMQWLKNIMSS